MKNSTQRKIGILLSYVTIVLNMIVSLVFTPILVNKLGQSEYGLYSLVSSIISYLTLLDLGFGSAIIIYSTKYRAKKDFEKEYKLYGMFIKIYSIIGIIAAILGLFLYLNVNNLFGSTMNSNELETAKILMLILTVNLSLAFPFGVFSSIITSYEKFVFAKLINIIAIILRQCLFLVLLLCGFKSISLAIVTTVVNLLHALFNLLYCKYKIKVKFKFAKIDFKFLLSIFAFSFWIFLNTVIDKINWSLDNFILGALSGTVAVSVYAVASQLNQAYILFSTAISNNLIPKIAKMTEKGASNSELTDLVIQTGRIQLMVVGLILGGFIVFGKQFVLLWVGKDYLQSYYIAIALMAPIIIPLTQNSCIPIAQVKNKHKFLPIVQIFTSILNIIISIPLVKILGGLGAALGTAVSIFIANILIRNIYYYKTLHINVIKFFKKLANISVMIIIESSIFMLGINYFNISLNSWISLFIGIIVYVLIYIPLILLCMNSYEKNLVNSFVRILKKKLK